MLDPHFSGICYFGSIVILLLHPIHHLSIHIFSLFMARSSRRTSWYDITEEDSDDDFVPRGMSVLGSLCGAFGRRDVLRSVDDGLSPSGVSRGTQTEMHKISRGVQTATTSTSDASSLTEIHQVVAQPSSSTSCSIAATMPVVPGAIFWPGSPYNTSPIVVGMDLDAGRVWPLVDNCPVFGVHFIPAAMAAQSLLWSMTMSHGGNVTECRKCCPFGGCVGVMQVAQHKVDYCHHMPSVGAVIWLEEQRSLWLFRRQMPATRIGLLHLQQYLEFPGPKVIIRSSTRGHGIMKPMNLVQRVVRLSDKVFVLMEASSGHEHFP
jgi:hypothetical protein